MSEKLFTLDIKVYMASTYVLETKNDPIPLSKSSSSVSRATENKA